VLVISGFLLASEGQYRTPPVIDVVDSGSAAAVAGLTPGDRITAVGGSRVAYFEDIGRLVMLHAGEPIRVDYVRGGRALHVVAVLKPKVEQDKFGNQFKRGLLGIRTNHSVIEPLPVSQVVPTAIRQTWMIVSMSVEGLGQVISGKRSVKDLGGPLKIAKFSGEQASLGLASFVSFAALISINLGFINLLPIPLLDGGHLFFYMIEGVRRKPLKPEAQEWAFRTGLAVLLALMVFITLNDLASFGLWSKLGGLIG
jgi:regulator of sigma E protease